MSSGFSLESLFKELFAALRSADYAWTTTTPDRLEECRERPADFDALTRYFGLGLEVASEELVAGGLPAAALAPLAEIRPAISRWGDLFVAHDHLRLHVAGAAPRDRVYLGEESQELISRAEAAIAVGEIAGKKVLDLGSGSGLLTMILSGSADRVLGIDSSAPATEWARASARAQDLSSAEFLHAAIGAHEVDGLVRKDEAERLAASESEGWDFSFFNPPLAIGSSSPRAYRDGGRLGIEIPLKFFEFSARHLRVGGEVRCLVTNPIVAGKSAFFDRISRTDWEWVERTRLHPRFNQALYRQDGYAELGIDRIELWYLTARRLGSS